MLLFRTHYEATLNHKLSVQFHIVDILKGVISSNIHVYLNVFGCFIAPGCTDI